MDCFICNNTLNPRIKKGSTQYYQCVNCETLFGGVLDQEGLVGGKFEVERNQTQNHIRLDRIDEMAKGMPKEAVRILDFGCGSGYLINDVCSAGYACEGYDAYSELWNRLPKKESYHIVTAVEVFEHFAPPYVELDVIHRSLVDGGLCMVETGFINAAIDDGHTIDDWFYIDPEAGHSTIYTKHGLDILMMSKGFIIRKSFNNYVKLYQKIKK